MPIAFKCTCGKVFRVPDGYAGKRTTCPNCSAKIKVPDAPQPGHPATADADKESDPFGLSSALDPLATEGDPLLAGTDPLLAGGGPDLGGLESVAGTVQSPLSVCPKCKTPLPVYSMICPSCGFDKRVAAKKSARKSETGGPSPVMLAGVLGGGVVCLALVLWGISSLVGRLSPAPAMEEKVTKAQTKKKAPAQQAPAATTDEGVPAEAVAETAEETGPPPVPPPEGELEELEKLTFAELAERVKKMVPGQRKGNIDFTPGGVGVQVEESQTFTEGETGFTVTQSESRTNVANAIPEDAPADVRAKYAAEVKQVAGGAALGFSQPKPAYSGAFAGDQRVGPWTLHHEEGKLRARGAYRGGKRAGVFRVFDDQGRLVWLGKYDQGKLVQGIDNPADLPKESGEAAALVSHHEQASRLLFSDDGKVLAVVGSLQGASATSVVLWDVENLRYDHVLDHPDWISGLMFAPGGASLLTVAVTPDAQQSSRARIWDVSSGKLITEFEPQGFTPPQYPGLTPVSAARCAFSRSGKLLAYLGAKEDSLAVHVWDLQAGKELHVIEGIEENRQTPSGQAVRHFTCVAFTPDERLLATGLPGRVLLWDALSGKAHSDNMVTPEPAAITFISNSTALVRDKSMDLWRWDVGSGAVRASAGSAIFARGCRNMHSLPISARCWKFLGGDFRTPR